MPYNRRILTQLSPNQYPQHKYVAIKNGLQIGLGVFAKTRLNPNKVILTEKITDKLPTPDKYSIQAGTNLHINCVGNDNLARIQLINHSCEPNSYLKVSLETNSVVVTSLKAITRGEEITWAYFWNELEITSEDFRRCHCGSKGCVKRMSGWNGLPAGYKQKLLKTNYLPRHIRLSL